MKAPDLARPADAALLTPRAVAPRKAAAAPFRLPEAAPMPLAAARSAGPLIAAAATPSEEPLPDGSPIVALLALPEPGLSADPVQAVPVPAAPVWDSGQQPLGGAATASPADADRPAREVETGQPMAAAEAPAAQSADGPAAEQPAAGPKPPDRASPDPPGASAAIKAAPALAMGAPTASPAPIASRARSAATPAPAGRLNAARPAGAAPALPEEALESRSAARARLLPLTAANAPAAAAMPPFRMEAGSTATSRTAAAAPLPMAPAPASLEAGFALPPGETAIRIATGASGGLDVRLGAATEGIAAELREQTDALAIDLAALGTEVDAIRVDLLGSAADKEKPAAEAASEEGSAATGLAANPDEGERGPGRNGTGAQPPGREGPALLRTGEMPAGQRTAAAAERRQGQQGRIDLYA